MKDQQKINRLQKETRIKNGNLYTKRYEKTKSGFLMRTYRNMLSRVSGILKKKAHLYYGKDILDKDTFYAFSLQSLEFNLLFDSWVEGGYKLKDSPSIDRKDTSLGYTIDNIQWITHSENSRKGAVTRWQKS